MLKSIEFATKHIRGDYIYINKIGTIAHHNTWEPASFSTWPTLWTPGWIIGSQNSFSQVKIMPTPKISHPCRQSANFWSSWYRLFVYVLNVHLCETALRLWFTMKEPASKTALTSQGRKHVHGLDTYDLSGIILLSKTLEATSISTSSTGSSNELDNRYASFCSARMRAILYHDVEVSHTIFT